MLQCQRLVTLRHLSSRTGNNLRLRTLARHILAIPATVVVWRGCDRWFILRSQQLCRACSESAVGKQTCHPFSVRKVCRHSSAAQRQGRLQSSVHGGVRIHCASRGERRAWT
ncbi:hypothetical protein LSAT2_032447 [Lamellibrachia satsuma]|nr:hypothetical protein LSAT2_032447 [Lamellibrachia satsuma]